MREEGTHQLTSPAPAPGPRTSRHFCTYLDAGYVDRAVVLHQSMREHAPDAVLRAVCFDDTSYRVLERLAPEGLEPIHATELESADPEFGATKESRSTIEYLWTATPCVLRWLLERDGLDELTYLDADMMLFSPFKPFFDELGGGSVLITPAASSPQHYSRRLAERAGLYVVQFITFRRDADGHEALEWWRERCIEDCPARYTDGRMGDQKYLDDWTKRFDGVHNLGHPGMLGPWNMEARDVRFEDGRVTVDGEPLVLFHYMGFRMYRNGFVRRAAGRFKVTPERRRWIYDPYVERLREARRMIEAIEPGYPASLPPSEPLRWRLQSPISAVIGSIARARIRVLPHAGVGSYLEGGYVPSGYEARRVERLHDFGETR